MMIHRPGKIYLFIYSKRYVDPCDPQSYAQSWENKQNKAYVGFPGGYDTGEERWRTNQQINDNVHKMKKCCCSLGRKRCAHIYSMHACTYIHTQTHTYSYK